MDDSLLTPDALLKRWPLASRFALPLASRVAVVGAYKGLVIDLLDVLYTPARITGFEPQLWAYAEAAKRLAGRSNVDLRPYALGVVKPSLAERRKLWEFGTDAASFFRKGQREADDVPVENITDIWPRLGPLDLVVMNCEGCEFELLPVMLEEGYLHAIDRLAVQFHLGLGNDSRCDELLEEIERTHRAIEVVRPETLSWVYWVRRELCSD